MDLSSVSHKEATWAAVRFPRLQKVVFEGVGIEEVENSPGRGGAGAVMDVLRPFSEKGLGNAAFFYPPLPLHLSNRS